MRRALFFMLCFAVMALTACGPSAGGEERPYVVGVIQLAQHQALDAATQGFKDALIERFGEGITFTINNAQGDPATCASIANGFVSSQVDLILANATAALQAAAAATIDIPIMGTSVTEYGVALGIKDFSGTVGRNISGTSDLAPLDEQANIVKSLFPQAKSIGLLYCSAEPNSLYQIDTIEQYFEDLGFTCRRYPFSDSNDLAAVTTLAAADSQVIYVPTDNTVASNTGIIDNICRPARIPVIAGEKSTCAGCGVATLSVDYYDLGYATGEMAGRVLSGQEDISVMAIEYAPKFTKMYNPALCAALDITVPEDYIPIED